ncbi:trehalose-phosphatase [Aquabacterium sp.]|uniref:trehalose-phosphatase n=1 Tax=Aquabacterium sp. TaxID=1872578 RepID=UPI003782DF2B
MPPEAPLEPPAGLQHLFSPEGDVAMSQALAQRPLLAFDFDGTLAPIVPHPDDARIAPAVAERLQALMRRLPVAIVTGRAVDDVRGRLGFEPSYVVGSHGAEDALDPQASAAYAQALDALRTLLRVQRPALDECGVWVEDKRQSIALHYRQSPERERAQALILELLSWREDEVLRIFPGKMVVNVMAREAPDKAHAMQALVARSGVRCALFAGDDVNDEPVFISAPPHWLTVRIGRDARPTQARFYLDSPAETALMLERLLARLA